MNSPSQPDPDPDPDRSNPWTTLSRRPVYENPWIAVREDQVLRPDGSPGIYGVVHFKNRAVGVLPIDDQGRIWLVGQYRYPLDAYSWEVPEGGCPESESPEETAHRELREETGLRAGRLELVATAHLSNSVSDELGYVFRATELTQGDDEPEGTERIIARRFDWDTAWAMLQRGEITDSLSVIALLHEAVRRLKVGQASA
jgi:8-oxo-dGTP pyrophosphatase MutT (NUDIX family)